MNSLFETSKAFIVYNIVSHVGGIHRKKHSSAKFLIFSMFYIDAFNTLMQ